MDNPERYRAPRIALFNHKGGVGKTTLTVNVASAMARRKKRVLLVDSDPQCNLTSYLLANDVVDRLLDESDDESGRTVWSALKPIADSMGKVGTIEPYETAGGLLLLAGDVRLAEFEQELHTIWMEAFNRRPRGFRGSTALSSLVDQVAREYEVDVVFYDSGPNIGALNRVILLDCEAFAIPAACDLFSIRATKTLGKTLVDWIKGWRTLSELAPDHFYLMPGKPGLLGYIPQRFKMYGGAPANDFARYLPQLDRGVKEDVAELLRRADPQLVAQAVAPLKIGEIKDFGTLVNKAERDGVALWEVEGGTPYLMEEALRAFLSLGDEILKRVGLDI